jgi:hypothetical protein
MRARLSLILAFAILPVCHAGAQAPWPSDPPRAGAPAAAPWPGPGAPAATPMPGSVAPPMSPMMGAPPGGRQASPFDGGGAPGGVPPCMAEFTKLREEVQKRGQVAKAASERKATREEMCKHIQAYNAAEAKWLKFTQASVSNCGIPPQVAEQLKQVHLSTEQTKEKVCAAQSMAVAPSAPSLSDALGTTKLPTAEHTKSGSGTLDTLTGNAIQR